MHPKSSRCLIISIVSLIILINVLSSSVIFALPKSWNDKSQSYANEDNPNPYILTVEIKIPKVISQNNTTNTTTTPTNTTTTTTTTTESEDTDALPGWKPNLNIFGNPIYFDENLYYPLALIFSVLGILSTLWLVFFVETSKDRTIRERIIGSTIRLVVMSLFLGLAVHFWILFEPI